jgi:hypothetical protein
MSNTSEFLTTASITTFGGATIAVWAISNALRVAFKVAQPWIPLVVSLAATFGLALISHHILNSALGYILTIVNGCLLFLSATGLQLAQAAEITGKEGAKRHGRQRVTWSTPWIKVRKAPPDASLTTDPSQAPSV